MAVSIYAKFPNGITGEAKQAGHEDEVVILSLSWGVSRPATLTGNSRQTGVPSFSDVSLAKETDSASHDLFMACAKATALDEIVITFVRKFSTGLVTFHYSYFISEKVIVNIELI